MLLPLRWLFYPTVTPPVTKVIGGDNPKTLRKYRRDLEEHKTYHKHTASENLELQHKQHKQLHAELADSLLLKRTAADEEALMFILAHL